jgi:hypothetical protein
MATVRRVRGAELAARQSSNKHEEDDDSKKGPLDGLFPFVTGKFAKPTTERPWQASTQVAPDHMLTCTKFRGYECFGFHVIYIHKRLIEINILAGGSRALAMALGVAAILLLLLMSVFSDTPKDNDSLVDQKYDSPRSLPTSSRYSVPPPPSHGYREDYTGHHAVAPPPVGPPPVAPPGRP